MDLLLSVLSGKAEPCWLEPGPVQGTVQLCQGCSLVRAAPTWVFLAVFPVCFISHMQCSPWLSCSPSLASLCWTEVCRLASSVWITTAFTVPVHNASSCKHFCCGLQHLSSPVSKPFSAENQMWLRFCFHHSSQCVFALVSIVAKICFKLIIWALNDWEKPPSCTVALQK